MSEVLSEVEKEGAVITDVEPTENEDVTFEPLFEDEESITEDQLKGEEESPAAEDAATPGSEGEEKPEKKPEEKPEGSEEKKEPEKEAEEKPEEKEADEKPPKGFVEIQALHEARENVSLLKQHVTSLERNNELLQSQINQIQDVREKGSDIPDEFKDFKVLSDTEWKEMVNDDVEKALIYKDKFDKYNNHLANQKRENDLELSRRQQIDTVIQNSASKIAESVPGIYEQDSDIQQTLYNFSVENGFNGQFLSFMSNPATRIIPVGQDGKPTGKTYPLGEGAVSLVTMIHKLKTTIDANNPEKLRSEITKEVEAKLRDEISKEVIAKIKNNEDSEAFRSISDVPGGSNDEPHFKKNYTEKDFFNMSAEEEKKALGG